jgi:DNA-binding MarR family transcriptional regulator
MELDTVDRLLKQWHLERPELDVTPLGVAIRIEMLAKLMRRDTADRLEQLGLKTWEYDVLSVLRRQGEPYELPMTELARCSLLTSGAMTSRIDSLISKGLVRREPNPDDRRGVRVNLSKKGLKLIDEAIGARLDAAEAAVCNLTRKERLAAEAALRKLLLATE